MLDRVRGVVRIFWREIAKFGVLEAFRFLIDFGGFNELFYRPVAGRLTTAKIISEVAATFFAGWATGSRRSGTGATAPRTRGDAGLAVRRATPHLDTVAQRDPRRARHDLAECGEADTIIGTGLATIFRF